MGGCGSCQHGGTQDNVMEIFEILSLEENDVVLLAMPFKKNLEVGMLTNKLVSALYRSPKVSTRGH